MVTVGFAGQIPIGVILHLISGTVLSMEEVIELGHKQLNCYEIVNMCSIILGTVS